MNNKCLCIVLLFVIISSNLKSQDRVYKDVDLTFIKDLKLSDHGVYNPDLLSANERGDIVVFDYAEYKLAHATVDNMEFNLFSKGGRGRGPAEFQMVMDLELDEEGNIYITDSRKGKLVQWNTLGEFIKEYKANKHLPAPSRLTRCSNGNLYVLSQQYSKKGIFHRVSKEGKLLNSFFKIDTFEKRLAYFTDGRLSCDENEYLYHSPLYINEIKKFNSDGELIFKIPIYGFEKNEKILVKDGRFYDPAPDIRRATGDIFVRDGIMIVAYSDRKDMDSQLLDVYSSEKGVYQYSIEIPSIFNEIAVTSKNIVLLREDKSGEFYISLYSHTGI